MQWQKLRQHGTFGELDRQINEIEGETYLCIYSYDFKVLLCNWWERDFTDLHFTDGIFNIS